MFRSIAILPFPFGNDKNQYLGDVPKYWVYRNKGKKNYKIPKILKKILTESLKIPVESHPRIGKITEILNTSNTG